MKKRRDEERMGRREWRRKNNEGRIDDEYDAQKKNSEENRG